MGFRKRLSPTMGMSRAWLFRGSVAGNLLLLTYVALYSSSTPPQPTYTPPPSAESPQNLVRVPKSDLQTSPQAQPLLLEKENGNSNPGNSAGSGSYPAGEEVNNGNAKPAAELVVKSGGADGGVVWDGDDSALGEGIAADLVSLSLYGFS